MEIVPVIDLKGGVVVRARAGDRARYRPIETPLSPTSEPVDVVAGLLSLHPFRSLYVADLDAIERRGDNFAAIDALARRWPELQLWIDNGCSEAAAAERLWADLPGARLVLGSESQPDTRLVRDLRGDARVVLSLDWREDRFLGPQALLEDPSLWPRRVILMTLARVGSGSGPDLERFRATRRRRQDCAYYLAGGLRDAADLAAVEASGAAGILVASALHDGRLTAADLACVIEAATK